MRAIDRIYIHCSYSEYGNVNLIRSWHTSPPNNWKDIGYHFIVYNQFTDYDQFVSRVQAEALSDDKDTLKKRLYSSNTDGRVVTGRLIEEVGAHVGGDNATSVGICYVGITPTAAQFNSLLVLCVDLMTEYHISPDAVFGHYEYYLRNNMPMEKTCPNFDMENFRKMLKRLTK
jgi:hypothetical protein